MRILAGLAAVTVVGGVTVTSSGAAQTEGTVVTAEVLSATNISIDPSDPPTAGACLTGTPGATEFGAVLPNTPNVTSADCRVVFGSSNHTSMLRISQQDGLDTAMRALEDDALDPSLGGTGFIRPDAPGTTSDSFRDVAIDAAGRIVVAGSAGAGGDQDWLIARFSADGTPDASFDGDGFLLDELTVNHDVANGLVIDSSGRLVVAGYSNNGTDSDLAIARYNADGTPDTSFDGDGYLTVDVAGFADSLNDVAIDSDGKIVVFGHASMSVANRDYLVARFNTDGSPDTSFNGTGFKTGHLGIQHESLRVGAIDPSGDIVGAGEVNMGAPRGDDMLVVRLTDAGAEDTSFDGDGWMAHDITSNTQGVIGMTLDSAGRIITAGMTFPGNQDIMVTRLLPNGMFDNTFDGDGVRIISFGAGHEHASDVNIDAQGRLVLTGVGNGLNDFLVVRLDETGAFDGDFGAGGVITHSHGADVLHSAVIDGFGRIVGVGHAFTGPESFAAILRWGDLIPVNDYSNGVTDWDTVGTGMFGACLRALTGVGVTPGWTVDADNDCTASDSDPWYPIPATPGGGSTVAASTTTGVTDATALLRFGFRPAATQLPGSYTAPLHLEALAPNV